MALVETRSPPTLTVMTALLPVAGGTTWGNAAGCGSVVPGSAVVGALGSSEAAVLGSSAANGCVPTVPAVCVTVSAITAPATSSSIRTAAAGASRLPGRGRVTTTDGAFTTFHRTYGRPAAATVTAVSRRTAAPAPSTVMTSGRVAVGVVVTVIAPARPSSSDVTDQKTGPSPSGAATCMSMPVRSAIGVPSGSVTTAFEAVEASDRDRWARSAKTPWNAASNVPGDATAATSWGPAVRIWGLTLTVPPAGTIATPRPTGTVLRAARSPTSARPSAPTVSRSLESLVTTPPPTSSPTGISSSTAAGFGVTLYGPKRRSPPAATAPTVEPPCSWASRRASKVKPCVASNGLGASRMPETARGGTVVEVVVGEVVRRRRRRRCLRSDGGRRGRAGRRGGRSRGRRVSGARRRGRGRRCRRRSGVGRRGGRGGGRVDRGRQRLADRADDEQAGDDERRPHGALPRACVEPAAVARDPCASLSSLLVAPAAVLGMQKPRRPPALSRRHRTESGTESEGPAPGPPAVGPSAGPAGRGSSSADVDSR